MSNIENIKTVLHEIREQPKSSEQFVGTNWYSVLDEGYPVAYIREFPFRKTQIEYAYKCDPPNEWIAIPEAGDTLDSTCDMTVVTVAEDSGDLDPISITWINAFRDSRTSVRISGDSNINVPRQPMYLIRSTAYERDLHVDIFAGSYRIQGPHNNTLEEFILDDRQWTNIAKKPIYMASSGFNRQIPGRLKNDFRNTYYLDTASRLLASTTSTSKLFDIFHDLRTEFSRL